VVFTAANLTVTAAIAVLEGCGKMAEVATLRLGQSVFSVTTVWIVLSLGGHLYALAASSLMMALVGLTWLWVKYRGFFKDLFSHRTPMPGMNWRREIWPFQWRIAVSCMSGYLISQLFTPLLFATHGSLVAGKMGMSLQIIHAMNSVALAWITTKAPTYGRMIAIKQTNALDTLFFRGLAQSFGILLIGVISVLLIFFYLTLTESPYAIRVLPPYLFAILSLVCLANHIVCAEAAGAVYSYATTALLIGLGGGTAVFFRKRREWAGRQITFVE
jgi:hypothetical protein